MSDAPHRTCGVGHEPALSGLEAAERKSQTAGCIRQQISGVMRQQNMALQSRVLGHDALQTALEVPDDVFGRRNGL